MKPPLEDVSGIIDVESYLVLSLGASLDDLIFSKHS